MKKLISALVAVVAFLGILTGCGINGSGTGTGTGNGTGSSSSVDCSQCSGNAKLDLDTINDYIEKNSYWQDFNDNGNKVTLIPFTHINGPRDEWKFFAIVNFEYDATTYFKYQVTYLSCTCREADVNYWQTAYVELSVPGSGNADDVRLEKLSFEKDGTGHYNGGFWGDSGVTSYIPRSVNQVTYDELRDGFIPYLVGKTKGELSQLSVVEDIDANDFATKMNGVTVKGAITSAIISLTTASTFDAIFSLAKISLAETSPYLKILIIFNLFFQTVDNSFNFLGFKFKADLI